LTVVRAGNTEVREFNAQANFKRQTVRNRIAIDFDISWIWDRIQDPQPRSDGSVPESDDFRTTVGLTFDFSRRRL
jgi:hypothetical protein